MSTALIVLQQTLTMGIYMLLGFILYKAKIITKEGSKTLAAMLVKLIIPAMTISGFLVEFSVERLQRLGWSFLLSFLALLLSILVSTLIFKKDSLSLFASSYSNAGFIGIPLARAALGEEAVFLIISYVSMLNILQVLHGIPVLRGEKPHLRAKDLKTPMLISAVIGFLIFVTGLGSRLPAIVSGAVRGVANMNAPMAMILLGTYLAESDIKRTVSDLRIFKVSAIRLLLVPVLTLGMLLLFPVDNTLRMVVMLAAAAPVGANAAVYSQLTGGDYPFACQTVAQSTVLSIATLPAIVLLAGILIK